MKKATQKLLKYGLILSLLPSLLIALFKEPWWMQKTIFVTSAYVFVSILCFSIIIWLIKLKFENKYLNTVILSIALPFVLIPNLYLNGAVLLGRQSANFQSWHLLSLFSAMYQIVTSIFCGLISITICIILFFYGKRKSIKT